MCFENIEPHQIIVRLWHLNKFLKHRDMITHKFSNLFTKLGILHPLKIGYLFNTTVLPYNRKIF